MAERLHLRSVELEVPLHDCDPLGIVWHGNYYKYFEIARTRLLRDLGLDRGSMIGPRYRFVVVESRCRHAWPLRYGQNFRVDAWLGDTRHRLRILFEVTNLEESRRAARGHTVLATTDLDGRMLLETPPDILERIEAGGAVDG